MKTFPSILVAAALVGCAGDEEMTHTGMHMDTGMTARVLQAPQSTVVAQPAPVVRPVELGDESVLTVSHDAGADGTIDRATRTTFDGNGDRLMVEEDRDGDGVFEEVSTFEHFYDGDQLVRIEIDTDADGLVDQIEHRTWTPRGQPLMTVKDTDADGTADRIEQSEYDTDGRRVQWRVDSPVGGEVETVQEFHYANGQATGRTLRRVVNGTTTQTTEYTNPYRPDGRLDAMLVDIEGDGNVNNRITRDYDPNGRLIGTITDTGDDGVVDNRSTQTYDSDGRLVLLTIDIGADGTPDTLIYRDYVGFDLQPQRCLTR